jgi:hypothetical protein
LLLVGFDDTTKIDECQLIWKLQLSNNSPTAPSWSKNLRRFTVFEMNVSSNCYQRLSCSRICKSVTL